MDVVAALSARAAQGRIHLGHRRLLLSRHHARRRDADHRHGGDERVPPGTAVENPRAQRPSADPAAGIAAHRLGRGRRPRLQGCRASARRPAGRGPGAGVLAVQRRRRAGPRHARRRSGQAHLVAKQHQAGHARRLRRRARASPSAAGSPSSFRCAPATTSRWWRRAAR